MKNEPSLEDLGLDAPAKITDKISIERLQRESDYETEMAPRPITTVAPTRNVAMDIGALLLSIVLPGAGHGLKGRWGAGLAWLVVVLIGYFLFFWPGVVLHVLCIADAIRSEPS